jgi:hypothetical protein
MAATCDGRSPERSRFYDSLSPPLDTLHPVFTKK